MRNYQVIDDMAVKMENIEGGVQDMEAMPKGTFRGGEQQDTETMPKGTFRGGEQQDTETMPKGTFRGGEQQDTETMPKGTFRGGEQQDTETMPKGTFRGGDQSGYRAYSTPKNGKNISNSQSANCQVYKVSQTVRREAPPGVVCNGKDKEVFVLPRGTFRGMIET